MSISPYLTPHTKTDSKWIRDLSVNQNYRSSRTKQKKTICDFGLGKDFIDTTPKLQTMKGKADKLNLSKLKSVL